MSSTRGGRTGRPRGAGRPAAAGAGTAIALLLLSGCNGDAPDRALGAQPSAAPAVQLLAIPAPPPPSSAVRPGERFVRAADGSALPDRTLTPGAFFADVTTSDVCDLHYTHGVRQPQFNDKVQAFAGYGISIRDRESYRVDHLIPVNLGGNNAQENLWPQPLAGAVGAEEKDALEVHLRALVCAGQVPLAEAQAALSRDWRAAHDRWADVPLPPEATRFLPPGSGSEAEPEDPVSNGRPCGTEGQVGRTRSKGIKFTCTRGDDASLTWRKRY